MNNMLIFNQIPQTWEHYLPLGNGRLGLMQKTHPGSEVLQLNEEGIWSGGPQNRLNPDSKKYLKKIRTLIDKGNVLNAQELAFQTLSGTSYNQRVYQTAGDFKIDFYQSGNEGLEHGYPVEHKNDEKTLQTYKSILDLEKAMSIVTYSDSDGVTYTKKTWISAASDMIFMYVAADKKGSINFNAILDRGIWCDNVYAKNDCIFLQDCHGIPFTVGAGFVVKASVRGADYGTKGSTLTGTNCDAVLFFIDIQAWQHPGKSISRKDYNKSIQKDTWTGTCEKKLFEMKKFVQKQGVEQAAEQLIQMHLDEYSPIWNSFQLNIGLLFNKTQGSVPSESLATPDILSAASSDNVNLVNLYANFCRYLLISSSRTPGKLPANLQGIWNCYMDPPWGSKYTININAQMNYWPVEMTGLSDCHLSLINLLERAYENGVVAAKQLYGCSGYVLHHNTDFWGDAAPQDGWIAGTYWVLGAAWLATHIWEHFEYTQDIDFLKKYYYLLHEACLFFVDFLQPSSEKADDKKPYLVINPSVSPENTYITKTGEKGTLCAGCQMDNMLLEHLFKSCIKAGKVLGEQGGQTLNKKQKPYNKKDFENFDYVLNHLKKPGLNPDGSLMEWNQVVEEVEKGHRHVSHLYGLFPGISIDARNDQVMAQACKKTLSNRLSNGGGHTGWSQAWIINFYVQLGMGDAALDSIVKLLSKSTLPNLLDNHPPFQIDGNFGALAGIVRMIVQSKILDDDRIQVIFLGALPKEENWQNGSIKGVKIKGGIKLDLTWENGKIKEISAYKNDKKLLIPELIPMEDGGFTCYF